MCTYNGQKFLFEQLESIIKQNYNNWSLWISDDGSTDNTIDIIYKIKKIYNTKNINIINGPQKGFRSNFLSLTTNQNIEADLYFWSDQDDIWLPDKITRTISLVEELNDDIPILYCGRTIIFNNNNEIISYKYDNKKIIFKNALLECIPSGNTVAFNNNARILISLGNNLTPFSHDWWAYLVVSGVGGKIIYDQVPTIKYRQHHNNLIGANKNIFGKLLTLSNLFKGNNYKIINENLNSLENIFEQLSLESKNTLQYFLKARKATNIFIRFINIVKSGVFRQKKIDNIIYFIALLLKRV